MADSIDDLPGWLQALLVIVGVLVGLLGVRLLSGGSEAAILLV